MDSGNLKQALTEIKNMLGTPLKNLLQPTTPNPVDEQLPAEVGSNSDDIENEPPVVAESKSTTEKEHTAVHITEGDSIAEGDLPEQFTRVIGKSVLYVS